MNLLKKARGGLVHAGMRVPLSAWRRLRPVRQVRLYYHILAENQPHHLVHYPVLTPGAFASDLDLLEEEFGLLDADGASSGTATGALITFDDGLVEVFEIARPMLLKRAATMLFFVTEALIGNKSAFHETESALCLRAALAMPDEELSVFLLAARSRPDVAKLLGQGSRSRGDTRLRRGQFPALTANQQAAATMFLSLAEEHADMRAWACDALQVAPMDYVRAQRPYVSADQLRQMTSEGFVIGGHGLTHRKLGHLDPAGRSREILDSCDRIRQITGQARVPFSFPYSGNGVGAQELDSLAQANPWVGPFYDSGGLKQAAHRLHRIWAESSFRGRGSGGLEAVLRHAWAAHMI